MTEILEAMMVICFGISWPISIYKSIKSRSSKGKSLIFLLFILIGYICGIASKISGNKITYVLYFYILNFIMVSIDIALYLRNTYIEKLQRSVDGASH
ncbi:MAG: hypothetical protein K0Q87_4713 [Neobacillus sp.]|jgi:hypothetical protein|nr:hypothetical protein [Neobacillus sp.]